MISLLRYLLLLTLVLWIGGIVFFSFIASPSIFKVLAREQAGQVVGDIFPKYHLLGYVSCIIALACLFGLRQLGGAHSIRTAMIVLVLMGGIQVTMGAIIGPKVIEARDAIKATSTSPEKERLEKKFRGLHGVSMIFNLVLLILGLVLLYWLSLRLKI
ncbi:MAG TPA: DUF4149 domain-containing protein [Nitrospirales bacterium]